MIEEPYRWVEAIANRREYIEDQLARGSPILLMRYADGLLLLTVSRETQKIFEVYDRIGLAALGHPADIERMRLAAIDLAHVEGFNRAVADVSLRRLVNFGLSPALKTAFEQIYQPPFIVKLLLAELGDSPALDWVVKLDYDGSFGRGGEDGRETFHVLAGTAAAEQHMMRFLMEHDDRPDRELDDAVRLAARAWAVGMYFAEKGREHAGEEEAQLPAGFDAARSLREHLRLRHVEAAVLDRTTRSANRYRRLDERELRGMLKDL
ncbi:MAG: hypothetical protein N3A53_06330 [Verrucomicrobiae bacterium]|nr:hypothetical protein [Verrucomicrobiae bacterium]